MEKESYLKRNARARHAYYIYNRDRIVVATRIRRQKRIRQLKDLFGAKCSYCGYAKNYAALDFHHVKGKSFGLTSTNMTKDWGLILEESKRCILICRNCHAEKHWSNYNK